LLEDPSVQGVFYIIQCKQLTPRNWLGVMFGALLCMVQRPGH
jgi:hypothetical protein